MVFNRKERRTKTRAQRPPLKQEKTTKTNNQECDKYRIITFILTALEHVLSSLRRIVRTRRGAPP